MDEMPGPGDSIERTVKIDYRLNIISIANLVVMLGVLFTAISTWYGLVYKVESTQNDIAAIRQSLVENIAERKAMQQDQNNMTQRLYRIESKVEFQSETLNDIKESVDKLEARP